VKVVEVPPGPPVLAPIVAEIYGPDAAARRAWRGGAQGVRATAGIVDVDDSHRRRAEAPRTLLVDRAEGGAMLGVPQQAIGARCAPAWPGDADLPARRPKYPAAAGCSCRRSATATSTRCCSCGARADGKLVPMSRAGDGERHPARAADPPQGPAAGGTT
jgi:hypothetical protein